MSQSTARIQAFDGCRWLLFLIVFYEHFTPRVTSALVHCLDGFFVMSGFLIGGSIIRASWETPLRVARNFYVRRILRLFPAFFLVATWMWMLGYVRFPTWTFLHCYNIKLFLLSMNHFKLAPGEEVRGLQTEIHFWSLAMEEQVYLVLSLLFFLRSKRYWVPVLSSILLVCMTARWYLTYAHPYYYRGALIIGAGEYSFWGALFASPSLQARLRRLNSPGLTWGSAVVALLLAYSEKFHTGTPYVQFLPNWRQTPMAISLAIFFWSISENPKQILGRCLGWKVWAALGQRTYVMYLLHFSLLALWIDFSRTHPVLSRPVAGLLALGSSVALSWLIWWLLERHIDKLKSAFSD